MDDYDKYIPGTSQMFSFLLGGIYPATKLNLCPKMYNKVIEDVHRMARDDFIIILNSRAYWRSLQRQANSTEQEPAGLRKTGGNPVGGLDGESERRVQKHISPESVWL